MARPTIPKGDVSALFSAIEKELPSGGDGWKACISATIDTVAPTTDPSAPSSHWKTNSRLSLQAQVSVPPEVKHAHELEALINDCAGTRDLSDAEFNDIVSDESSSDDDVEVIDDALATVHTAAISCFDPQTLRAWDEGRFNRAEQNTQVFLLSQQLRDAHSISDSLRNQLSIVQQQLHDAERSRDVVLLDFRLLDRSQDFSDSDKENQTPRGRLPVWRQIYYLSETPAAPRPPSPGPSRIPLRHRSPTPPRAATPPVWDSTAQDELTSIMTSNSDVVMVTPSRAGGVPLSFAICGPQPHNEKGKGKAAER
ncbi:hypothetical protein C8J57DRAFT_1545114 [Mycena rebaudengoi]|nr:hypothetical protein C8J57DRAFT_1545114 [Mycena rebaudengoi]